MLTQEERDAFVAASRSARTNINLPLMRAETLFDLGVQVSNISNQKMIADVATTAGIKLGLLNQARYLARQFKADRNTFLKEFKESGVSTIGKFISYKWPKPQRNKTLEAFTNAPELTNAITDLVVAHRQEPTQQRLDVLTFIHNYIGKNIPMDVKILDRNYIRYYNCAGCDTMAPEEGHQKISLNGLGIPMCPECLANGTKPDMLRVAVMYGRYAADIERAFNMVRYADED